MRRMSFALTKRQLLDHSKRVTRRLGWTFSKQGDLYLAVSKCMGLKPGEQANIYGVIEVLSARREPLNAITPEDCALEGFPELSPRRFVEMFLSHMKGTPETMVTRIEFDPKFPAVVSP